MTEPGPHGLQRTGPRLTVARASAAQRQSVRDQVSCRVVDGEAIAVRSESVAAERAAERMAVRNREAAAVQRAADALAHARARHERIRDAQQSLRDGAAWLAESAEAELAAAAAAVAEAETLLEARQVEHRAAVASLDRVLEQRATANAAMSDAEQQLADLGVAEMDESGLRRELEASGNAVRSAQEAHAEAVAALHELRLQRDDARQRHAELIASLQPVEVPVAGEDAVASVQAAVERWDGEAAAAGPDRTAAALADAWNDLHADLASIGAEDPVPDAAALAAAEERVTLAAAALAGVEAATGAGPLSPEARAELDAAHDAVQAAEERGQRRLGAAAVRRELERARAHEEELLARHGFGSYIDVVLTGGRARKDSPALLQAARTYRNAVAERDRLVAAMRARPELAYLEGERARLHQHCVDVLGVDPGDDVIGLLWGHPGVPALVVQDLKSTLEAVGVRPFGISLRDAAARWLDAQRSLRDEREGRELERTRRQAEADEAAAELQRLDDAVAAAERTESEAVEALEMASRSVSAFESELSMRADEDARRLQRFAAAEQLRAQVAALSHTLVQAEDDARALLDRAATALARAESDVDRAATRHGEVSRRVRTLAAELPTDARLDDDPLTELALLSTRLLDAAERLDRDVAAAEALVEETLRADGAASAALAAAAERLEGPQPEDQLEALTHLLSDGDRVIVLDEPFDDRWAGGRGEAQAAILAASARRTVVLLTADPELLGWAIELPSEVGTVVPVDALNLGGGDAEEPPARRAILELDSEHDSSDDAAPTRPAPRWAGRR